MASRKTSSSKKKHGAGAKFSDGNGLEKRLEEVESSHIFRTRTHEHSARQGEASLKNVLRCNGEEHLYDKIMKLAVYADDDPPWIFGWKFVHEFVQAVDDANNQAANGGAAVPAPPARLNIPNPLTREAFKEALLLYARVGRADPLGTACLPCEPSEFGQAVSLLDRLSDHAWTQHIIAVGGAAHSSVAREYTGSNGVWFWATRILDNSIATGILNPEETACCPEVATCSAFVHQSGLWR
ncbi:unnamed protein product [Phytophthora fragariaefolia]|uniref:Unnamed protein product n=1 Tax=Phytophthora fragariaefolia TaxID=1490495 RepID=A0A9W7D2R9_9STRA|nr:unnamed protein product [Phytophthora fragariaefolia]